MKPYVVSRSFAPKCGVAEDPACGSGHCHTAPHWCGRLGKTELAACQASCRGGTPYRRTDRERAGLAGQAVLFSAAGLRVAE